MNITTNYGATHGVEVLITVSITADTNSYEMFTLKALKHATGWYYTESKFGNNSGVSFAINSLGDLVYSSPTYTGFVSGESIVKVIPLK